MEGNTVPRDERGLVQRAGAKVSVRVRALGTLCAVAWTAACGSAPAVSSAPAPSEVRQTRECRPEEFPMQLPALAALVDTAALSAGVRTLRDSARVAAGEVVLTLWYEPDGVNVRRDVLRHSLTPLLADSVQKLVFSALRQAPEMESPWGARLRVDLAGAVSYAVDRRVLCPPRPRNLALEGEMAAFLGTGVRYRGGAQERTVLMQVDVHPMGYVEDARVLRGAPSGGTLEQRLRDQVRQYSFFPAAVDGVPVRGQIAVPVRVRS